MTGDGAAGTAERKLRLGGERSAVRRSAFKCNGGDLGRRVMKTDGCACERYGARDLSWRTSVTYAIGGHENEINTSAVSIRKPKGNV